MKNKIFVIGGGHIGAAKFATIQAMCPHVELHVIDIDDPKFQEVKESEYNTRHFTPVDPMTFRPEGKKKLRDEFDNIPCPRPKGRKRFKNHK